MKTINYPSAHNQSIGYELVKAKEIINEFIYSCSHSMRGPLKSITGLINLLQKEVGAGKQDPGKYFALIMQCVSEMEDVLKQLEQSLENSKKNLTIEPVDLTNLINEVVNEVQKEAGSPDITFNVQVEQTAYFYSDINCFRLIMSNLVSNAVNFRDDLKEQKFIDILVNATKRSCSIHINDNGIGIASDAQDKIFQLFYRGSEKSAGSGVGLYVVHEIVKKMGGSISVNSASQAGSNFFVWIPNLAA
jgi:signal transduction histidine kinase